MSVPAPILTGPEMPITLKVNYDGSTRKFKLPLHDMVYPNLENKVRAALGVPSDVTTIFERYSDSAAVYVELDKTNAAIYKQLFRAAKAKGKLKLRLRSVQSEQKPIPKAVTVEDASDVVEHQVSAPPKPLTIKTEPQPLSLPISPLRSSFPTTLPLHLKSEEPSPKTTAFAPQVHSDLRKNFEERLEKMRLQLGATQEQLAEVHQSWLSPRSPCNPSAGNGFAVSCNNCEKMIPNDHYHCSTCDDGDFDLCERCVMAGSTCKSASHWLVKRKYVNGLLVNSTTETVAPKPKKQASANKPNEVVPKRFVPSLAEKSVSLPSPSASVKFPVSMPPRYLPPTPQLYSEPASWKQSTQRTCNNCVQDLPEKDFLHCKNCEDFDLCRPCFAKNVHGHNPMHAFRPAVAGTEMPAHITVKMAAGRNQAHHAICDGCDKFIHGIRHKCLDCPDWDYCSECVLSAHLVHAKHRFAALAEPIADFQAMNNKPVHMGICCDGPLCSSSQGYPSYIRGIRYKCAVCNDLDLCANCEASPANEHNKTHPLIMFKTPVRNVHVSTTGEHEDGRRMPAMGDACCEKRAAKAVSPPVSPMTKTPMPTFAEKTPEKLSPAPKALKKEVSEKLSAQKEQEPVRLEIKSRTPSVASIPKQDLRAVYLRDTVTDGTTFPANHVFEQTWVLRNEGNVTWPAGCSVKYVGGDYMGHVDSAHPAGISELVSASESTVCYAPLGPGQEFSFTVLLRTPPRAGRFISYWRLTTTDGNKFGHRLWCDVNVRAPPSESPRTVAADTKETTQKKAVVEKTEEEEDKQAQSQMVFPKLEKESPMSSMHEANPSSTLHDEQRSESEADFEDCDEEEWDGSESGFMTDEEYDILDASDEEFLMEQQNHIKK